MKLIRYGLLAALIALHNYARAWEISSSDAVAPSAPLNEHETLSKTWTITGDKTLDKLSVFTFGRVFVEYDASLTAAAAKVVFSGDNSDLLDAFEVTGDEEVDTAVSIRLRNIDIDTKGYLLTRVYVSEKQAVNTLAQALSANVVVGDDVMLQNDPAHNVTLASIGSGSVFFGSPSTELSLANLTISVVGSGDVQVVAKSVDLTSALNLIVAGSGDAAVVANDITVNDTLVVAIAGSGDTFVQSEHITTTKLSTVIAGSGSATYSRAGVCEEQEIAIVGSGDVAVGSIQCVNTNVSLAGSGDVVVQTSGNLSVTSLFGSGDVRYFGAKPSVINVQKSLDFFGHGKKQKVKQAKKNHYEEYEVQAAPEVELTYFEIKASKSSSSSNEPAIHELAEIDPSTNFVVYRAQNIQMNTAPGQAGHSTHALGIFALVGIAFAVVGVAAVDYKRRNERARYQSLV